MRPEENTGSVVSALKCTVKLKNHVIFFIFQIVGRKKLVNLSLNPIQTPHSHALIFSKNGSDFAEIFV